MLSNMLNGNRICPYFRFSQKLAQSMLMTTAMKATKTEQKMRRQEALVALQHAVIEGATWRYEHLAAAALELGVSDHQLDAAIHDALRVVFGRVEQTVTARELDSFWPADHIA
jgi:hypothetical protein